MKRISPLTILLISFALLLGSLIVQKKSKIEINESLYNVSSFNDIASDYKALNKDWNKKEKTKSVVEKIIKVSGIKNVTKKTNKGSLSITFNEKSISKIEKFVNRVLNESLIIKKLVITKESVEMEIKY